MRFIRNVLVLQDHSRSQQRFTVKSARRRMWQGIINLDLLPIALRLTRNLSGPLGLSNLERFRCFCRREDTTKDKYHYSLTWTCEFPNENDTYYFAHCYPYTYSDLQVCCFCLYFGFFHQRGNVLHTPAFI